MEIIFSIIGGLFGLLLAIIGYFLNGVITDVKDMKKAREEDRIKISVIESDYMNKVESLNDKISMLYNSIEKLSSQIESLNDKLSNK